MKMTPEQISKFHKLTNYFKRVQEANRINQEIINDIVNLVNKIFTRNGINETINSNHIKYNEGFIGNVIDVNDKKLSNIIFNHIYPKTNNECYSHFTSFQAASEIIKNQELWIFNLLKNFDVEEFRLFYEQHNITGFRQLRSTLGVKTDYRTLMSEIFSFCLTSPDNKSQELWSDFANGGTGVKITFEIENKNSDFKEVYYSNEDRVEKIPLLKDLFSSIEEEYNKPLIFTEISNMGSFYIHGRFSNEKEYRFLINRDADKYNARYLQPVSYDNDIAYIKLPFNSSFADFKIKRLTKGPNCTVQKFNKLKELINNNYPYKVEFQE